MITEETCTIRLCSINSIYLMSFKQYLQVSRKQHSPEHSNSSPFKTPESGGPRKPGFYSMSNLYHLFSSPAIFFSIFSTDCILPAPKQRTVVIVDICVLAPSSPTQPTMVTVPHRTTLGRQDDDSLPRFCNRIWKPYEGSATYFPR